MGESYGVFAAPFAEIIVFSNERDFKEIVSANPQMTAIIGADGYTKEHFPGVYIAGVTKG